MGGQSVPSSTFQQQNAVTGLWAVPELKQRALKLLDPSLKYTGEQQSMMLGVNKRDPDAMRKFYGLSNDAPISDITSAMGRHSAPTVEQAPAKAPTPLSYARGGLMSIYDDGRGFAEGGNTKQLTQEQIDAVTRYNNLVAQGKTPPEALINRLNTIEKNTGRNVSPYTDTGTAAVGNQGLQNSINKAAGSGNYPTDIVGTNPLESIYNKYPDSTAGRAFSQSPAGQQIKKDQTTISDAATKAGLTPADAYINTAGFQGMSQVEAPVIDPATGKPKIDPATGKPVMRPTGQWQVTDPKFLQLQANIDQMQKAPSQYGEATDIYNKAAAGLGGLANFSPQQVAAQDAAAASASAQQGSAQQAQASTINRGDIRDVNAQKADVERYGASLMNAPKAADVQGYDAALAKAAEMATPENVTTKALERFQMQGPSSWTDEGTAAKYMNPYQQGVIDIAKREKGRDYAKQLAGINAQAAAAGAFGGGRQAMERSEAGRNYEQQLQDLETQGLAQAYQSGMSQYGSESALGQQANIQNLQSLLGTQGQESSQALQAALANQQAGLTTGQANLQAAQQIALANQQAINQQQQQYVNNALQAEMQRYGGQLTAAQQNQVAQNAASQFNASSQNQANQNYVQQQLTAMLQNQGMDYQTASQNAQLLTNTANQNAQLGTQASLQNASLGTQAALQNASLATQTNQFNANQALQAGMANQQAGIQGAGLNLSAFNSMGNMAQGLGSLGTSIDNRNLALNQQRGTLLAQDIGLRRDAANQWTTNAGSVIKAPNTLAGAGIGDMSGLGGGNTGVINQANTGK